MNYGVEKDSEADSIIDGIKRSGYWLHFWRLTGLWA